MPLPEGRMRVRCALHDDLDAVVAVVRASERHHLGAPLMTRADLAGDWARPSLDLAHDTVVVEDGDEVVAYAELFAGRASVDVRPDRFGRGIGTALAAWSEDRARRAGLDRIGQTIPDAAVPAIRLLRGRGYQPRWQSWILRIDLREHLASPVLPAGLQLRATLGPDDVPAVYALIDTAFGDFRGGEPGMSLADWQAAMQDRLHGPDGLVLVAVSATGPVGALIGLAEEGEGWIDQVAVARGHRRRGVARALLQTAFIRFRDRGLAVSGLSTDSRTGARTLYEAVGMHVDESFTRWDLDLG